MNLMNPMNPIRVRELNEADLRSAVGVVARGMRDNPLHIAALGSDANQGVRMEALRLVEPLKADSSVRSVLSKLAENDQNASIRSQARTIMAQTPEMD